MKDIPDWEKRMDYWILEAQKEKKRADEAEGRHAAADRDREAAYKALVQTESLIQQKDTEIAKIKNMLLDAIGSLTMYGNDACEEQARRIARDLRKLTHLQPKHTSGDTP